MSKDDRDHWRLLEELFDRALELPADERTRFLDRECPDGRIRDSLLELLRSHDNAGAFLDPTQRTNIWPLAAPQPCATLIGRRIGRYRLTRLIGVGGMGAVYEAEQESPRRNVAVKIMRGGSLSRSATRRFVAEAELLARLDHPGVARIIEAGTAQIEDEQLPYFAMEFIRGVPLNEYLAAAALPVDDRLRLFVKICDAVQHAHQKSVVHRDLKPSNILVVTHEQCDASAGDTPHNNEPQPKILDFGIARATDSDVQVTTLIAHPSAILGTAAYMSPEQIRADVNAIDARSDVYALGVLLYEILAGRPPHDIRNKPIPEAIRIIADNDPPPLSAIDRSLRGDLSTIAATAMTKDPARRYQTAAALAEDVRRHLRHEPIAARPPGALYSFAKFIRRNRTPSAAAAILLFTLITSLIAIDHARHQAVQARLAAEQEYEEARRISNYFLTNVVTRLDHLPGSLQIRHDLMREIIRQTRDHLRHRPHDPQLLRNHARALETLAMLLHNEMNESHEARRLLQEALETHDRLTAAYPDDPWLSMRRAIAIVHSADTAAPDLALHERIALYRKALEIDAVLAQQHPDERRFLDNLYWSHARIGRVKLHYHDPGAANRLRHAADTARLLLERFPDHPHSTYAISDAHLNLAQLSAKHHDHETSLAHAEQALRSANPIADAFPDSRWFIRHLMIVHQQRASALLELARHDEAAAACRQALRLADLLGPLDTEDHTLERQRKNTLRLLARIEEQANPPRQ